MQKHWIHNPLLLSICIVMFTLFGMGIWVFAIRVYACMGYKGCKDIWAGNKGTRAYVYTSIRNMVYRSMGISVYGYICRWVQTYTYKTQLKVNTIRWTWLSIWAWTHIGIYKYIYIYIYTERATHIVRTRYIYTHIYIYVYIYIYIHI